MGYTGSCPGDTAVVKSSHETDQKLDKKLDHKYKDDFADINFARKFVDVSKTVMI